MRHKNVELVKVFVEGQPCEYYSHVEEKWCNVNCLSLFDTDLNIRITEGKRPDIVVTSHIRIGVTDCAYMIDMDDHNVQMTFDGESRDLISIEVIK
jgi:hypothetical protein